MIETNSVKNKVRVIPLALGLIGLVVFGVCIPQMWENLDSGEVMVIQTPIAGELKIYTDPGLKWQGFGSVTKYPRRIQYSFSSSADQGGGHDQSIKTTFNDGGAGYISGVVSWEMPIQPEKFARLHREYHGFEAIDQQLIRPMLEKVIFSAGATMSSTESSAERRPEIPQIIDDQMQNGPYLTKTVLQTQKDPITNQDKAVKVVQVQTDSTGKSIRASSSMIKEYGIVLSPVTINDIRYDKIVADQIAKRQEQNQAVQFSISQAVRATQDAITTAKKGEATAAEEKWKQEAINAKEIALAEKELKVAQLTAQTAEQKKKALILEGEGEAAKRKLIMEADGALGMKVEAWTKAQGFWANAFQNAKQPMVPQIMTGGGSHGDASSAPNNMQNIMEIIGIKAAKDLGLDLTNEMVKTVPTKGK